MKKSILICAACCLLAGFAPAADQTREKAHPDTSGWESLFAADLSNADKPEGVWTVSDGVLTASEDKAIWFRNIKVKELK